MKKAIKSAILEARRVLIMRTCNADMSSSHGFVWPKSGRVEAPDWKPTKSCGHGLHGFLRGEGDGDRANFSPDAVWIAAWVDESLVIALDGKVKFPWCEIALVGDRKTVTEFMGAHGCTGSIVGGTATAGDRGTATAGYRGTATAGYGGTATAGYGGILNIRYWDGKRHRIATFYVGENGIEAGTKYWVDESGRPEKAKE